MVVTAGCDERLRPMDNSISSVLDGWEAMLFDGCP